MPPSYHEDPILMSRIVDPLFYIGRSGCGRHHHISVALYTAQEAGLFGFIKVGVSDLSVWRSFNIFEQDTVDRALPDDVYHQW